MPLRVSAISVNWLTTSAAPPTSSRLWANFPVLVLEHPQPGDLACEAVALSSRVVARDPQQHDEAAPDLPDRCVVDGHACARHPLADGLIDAHHPNVRRSGARPTHFLDTHARAAPPGWGTHPPPTANDASDERRACQRRARADCVSSASAVRGGRVFGVAIEIEDPGRVVLVLGPQRAGQLVVAVGLGVPALLLERAAERVVRVVVGRRARAWL